MRTEHYGIYGSDLGFNYPDFDTFGGFGSVLKSKPEKSKATPSQFYEAPSKSQLLLPYYQNTTSSPQKSTYVTLNVVFTTPPPTSSVLPPAKPILLPPQQPFADVMSSTQTEENSFSFDQSVMLPSSSTPAVYKAPSPSEFVRDSKYQTHFKDTLDSPLYYQQQQLPSMKKQTIYQMSRDDTKPEEAGTRNDVFDEEYEVKTKETSAPQNMKVIFDFPCARSAIYDLNFVFKFCRKMGLLEEEVR